MVVGQSWIRGKTIARSIRYVSGRTVRDSALGYVRLALKGPVRAPPNEVPLGLRVRQGTGGVCTECYEEYGLYRVKAQTKMAMWTPFDVLRFAFSPDYGSP